MYIMSLDFKHLKQKEIGNEHLHLVGKNNLFWGNSRNKKPLQLHVTEAPINSSHIHTHTEVAGGTGHTWPGLTHKRLSLVSLPRA